MLVVIQWAAVVLVVVAVAGILIMEDRGWKL